MTWGQSQQSYKVVRISGGGWAEQAFIQQTASSQNQYFPNNSSLKLFPWAWTISQGFVLDCGGLQPLNIFLYSQFALCSILYTWVWWGKSAIWSTLNKSRGITFVQNLWHARPVLHTPLSACLGFVLWLQSHHAKPTISQARWAGGGWHCLTPPTKPPLQCQHTLNANRSFVRQLRWFYGKQVDTSLLCPCPGNSGLLPLSPLQIMVHCISAHPQTSQNTVPETCILVCAMAAPYVSVEMDLSYLFSFPDMQLKFLFFSPEYMAMLFAQS